MSFNEGTHFWGVKGQTQKTGSIDVSSFPYKQTKYGLPHCKRFQKRYYPHSGKSGYSKGVSAQNILQMNYEMDFHQVSNHSFIKRKVTLYLLLMYKSD